VGAVERGISRRLAIEAAAAALLAGTYLGVHASRGGSGRADRHAFFADVARRLDIDPPAFTGWRSGRARVTPGVAQRIRERLEEAGGGPLILFPHAGRRTNVHAAAHYPGVPAWRVRAELRDGASLAVIAAAHGKSVAGLRRAITAETRRRVEAITNLSDVERQQLLNHLGGRLDEVVRRDGRPAGWGAGGGP